jgi:murein DD-endopeptidase MepM/ murein hydrolase activator NlpD
VVTSRFGPRGRRHHHGIDIGAPIGTPITAARDGVVTFAGWLGGYGVLVILDHGAGLTTWYGHASKVLVEVGQRVQDGQLIARVGTTGHVTGPNLHFEVRRNNRPLDPLQFLRGTR